MGSVRNTVECLREQDLQWTCSPHASRVLPGIRRKTTRAISLPEHRSNGVRHWPCCLTYPSILSWDRYQKSPCLSWKLKAVDTKWSEEVRGCYQIVYLTLMSKGHARCIHERCVVLWNTTRGCIPAKKSATAFIYVVRTRREKNFSPHGKKSSIVTKRSHYGASIKVFGTCWPFSYKLKAESLPQAGVLSFVSAKQSLTDLLVVV